MKACPVFGFEQNLVLNPPHSAAAMCADDGSILYRFGAVRTSHRCLLLDYSVPATAAVLGQVGRLDLSVKNLAQSHKNTKSRLLAGHRFTSPPAS
jgi:hypothetical protein